MARQKRRTDSDPVILAALRHVPEEVDEIGARVLEAAHRLIARDGVQRLTMNEVAVEADITRITVYRRFATRYDLLVAVARTELDRCFAQFRADIAEGGTPQERIVLGFVSAQRTMRSSALVTSLLAEDRGALHAMLADERMIEVVAGFVAEQLRREQTAGELDDGVDVDFVAQIAVRMSSSYLVTPGGDERTLGLVAERVLVPLLGHTP